MNIKPNLARVVTAAIALLCVYPAAQAQPEVEASIPYSANYTGNATVGVAILRSSIEKEITRRDLRVVVSRNLNGPTLVECFFVVEQNGSRSVQLAGKDTCRSPEGVFDFRMSSLDKIAGWFVRLTHNGRVIGFAQSDEKYRNLSGQPASLARVVARN